VAEKEIGAAGGAEIAGKDVLVAEAGREKLRTIGFAEIEADVFGGRLVAGRLHVEPLERVGLVAGAGLVKIVLGIGKLGGEFGDEVSGDFVATGTDGRTDGGEEMRWVAAEFELHAANRFFGDAGQGAAPAGVNGGDGTFPRIDKKNRDAIGGLDGEEDAGAVGGGGIAFAGVLDRRRHEMDDIGVDLLESREVEIRGAQSGLKFASIGEDVFASVPFHEAEVQDLFGFESTCAAGAGAEGVDKPGEFAEGSEFEELEALGFAEAPGG